MPRTAWDRSAWMRMPWRMSGRAEMRMTMDSGDRFGGFDGGMAVFVAEFASVGGAGGGGCCLVDDDEDDDSVPPTTDSAIDSVVRLQLLSMDDGRDGGVSYVWR